MSAKKRPVLKRARVQKYLFYFNLCVADDGEILSLEGSATYETAVDVRLSEEACSVLGIAGTAVLDRDSLSALRAIELSDDATDELANFFSLLVCSCLACADSPDRLISDNE